jgi:hypothetical protein
MKRELGDLRLYSNGVVCLAGLGSRKVGGDFLMANSFFLVLSFCRVSLTYMSLRAKRAALTAKVAGGTGPATGNGDAPAASNAPPSPRPVHAGSTAATAPVTAGSPSPDTVASQREKLDQIAASFSPTIIGGHQAKQPPSYIFEDSVRGTLPWFLQELVFIYHISTQSLESFLFKVQ